MREKLLSSALAAAFGSHKTRFLAVAAVSTMLSACGTTVADLSTSSIATYTPASIFSPVGYSIANAPGGGLRVTASGPPGTPVDRLEKIALARAAEYGNEQHLKTFKASPPQTSFTCGKTKTYIKGEKVSLRPLDYRVVTIDVSYGTDGMDPAAKPTKETAEKLKAELQTDTVPPDVQAAATQEVNQQCGRQG